MATLYQHPRAPVTFHRERPRECIGRCPTCSGCAYPQTVHSVAAARAARRREWASWIIQRLVLEDEARVKARVYGLGDRLDEPARTEYLALADRILALWANGVQP